MSQRQIAAIRKLTDDELWLAYWGGYKDPNVDAYDPITKAVIESRLLSKIADETRDLARLTQDGQRQVIRLAESSERIESLTDRLNKLTWMLIALTTIAIFIGAVQTWKMFMPEPPDIKILATPPAPPSLPAPLEKH